jgi:hypothetical protein
MIPAYKTEFAYTPYLGDLVDANPQTKDAVWEGAISGTYPFQGRRRNWYRLAAGVDSQMLFDIWQSVQR